MQDFVVLLVSTLVGIWSLPCTKKQLSFVSLFCPWLGVPPSCFVCSCSDPCQTGGMICEPKDLSESGENCWVNFLEVGDRRAWLLGSLWLRKAEDKKTGILLVENMSRFVSPGSDHVSTMNAVLSKLLFVEVHSSSEFRSYLDATIVPPALRAVAEEWGSWVDCGRLWMSKSQGKYCAVRLWWMLQPYGVPVMTQFFQSLIVLQEMPDWTNVVYQTKHMFVVFGSLASPSSC